MVLFLESKKETTGCAVAVLMLWGCLLVMCLPEKGLAWSGHELQRFQGQIVDYRHRINPGFHKRQRPSTRLIIVHTSELGLEATLRVVSTGKTLKGGRHTPGGHANYVVARNGRTYRILDRRFRADHAGLSMWNGIKDVSRISIGIELVGYHNAPLTDAQYRSVGMLLSILKKVYRLDDRDILTHSQVAYGSPNPWFKTNHRGRKRCAQNFDRARAGLGPTWSHDPDVRAGRLAADPLLVSVFYGTGGKSGQIGPSEVLARQTNLISKENSAWSIAGEDYNDAATAYVLPQGRIIAGDQVAARIGWDHLPAGTRVLLNQVPEQVRVQAKSPVKKISGTMTAWSHAGQDFSADTTIYFLPSGRISPGSSIRDWDDLPAGTRLMVGYKGPYAMTRTRTAYKIAGGRYNHRSVVYHMPSGRLVTGDKIKDFADLPTGVTLYLPVSTGG